MESVMAVISSPTDFRNVGSIDLENVQHVLDSILGEVKALPSGTGSKEQRLAETIRLTKTTYGLHEKVGTIKNPRVLNEIETKISAVYAAVADARDAIKSGPDSVAASVGLQPQQRRALTELPVSGESHLHHVQHNCSVLIAALRQHVGSEGLFRLSGTMAVVKGVVQGLKANPQLETSQLPDNQNDLAGILKGMLREMPVRFLEPVEAELLKVQSPKEAIAAIKGIIAKLPEENRAVLNTLFTFLADVASHVDTNRMGPDNLATCMAPNLFKDPDLSNPMMALAQTKSQNACIAAMIANANEIFN